MNDVIHQIRLHAASRPELLRAGWLERVASRVAGVVLGGVLLASAAAPGLALASPPVGGAGSSASSAVLSPEANEIDVDEQLGEYLDPDLTFVDSEGREVKMGDFIDGKRPMLLTLNYYRCPTLCNVQLNSLTEAMREFDWTPGDENFHIVTVSIDPRETPKLAKEKRANHLAMLDKTLEGGESPDWAFLTGDAINIKLLAAQLGIGYAYDRGKDQYAHPPVVVFISPDGKIARYIYGLTYDTTRDIKFGLMEAAEGRVGSPVDKIILSCFHYDASEGRYGPFALGIMRLGGGLMVLLVGTVLFFFWRRERRRAANPTEAMS